MARPQHQAGAHPLAEHRIGVGHAGHVEHGRVGQDEVLHLLRADLLAAPVDQVLDPALDHVVAGRQLPEQVTGPVEPVRGERPRVVLGRAEVAAQRVRAADDQLAGLAVGHHVPVLVHQVDLVVGRGGPAARFPPYSGRIEGPDEHDQALGHAEVLLDEAAGQGALGAQPDLRLEPLPAALDHPQPRTGRTRRWPGRRSTGSAARAPGGCASPGAAGSARRRPAAGCWCPARRSRRTGESPAGRGSRAAGCARSAARRAARRPRRSRTPPRRSSSCTGSRCGSGG